MSITFFILFILFNISFSLSEKILVIFLYGNERKLLLSVVELFILWNVNAFNEFTLEGSKLNFDLSISFSVSIGYEDESNYDIQFDGNKISPLQNLNKDYNNNLNLKILCKGKIIYDPINFQPTKSTIRIGRNSNCEVVVEDHLLSRIHCTIVYRKNIGWIIRDGVYNKNKDGSIEMKPSTNGTWLYALEDMPIYEGMIIKSNNNLFKFSFLK